MFFGANFDFLGELVLMHNLICVLSPCVSDYVSVIQFKVLRDGCWTKVNFRRGEAPSRIANDPRDISVNPWVRHYRSGHRHQTHQTVASPSIQGKTILDSKNPFHMLQPNLCHHDTADSNTGSSHLYSNDLLEAFFASTWLLMGFFVARKE